MFNLQRGRLDLFRVDSSNSQTRSIVQRKVSPDTPAPTSPANLYTEDDLAACRLRHGFLRISQRANSMNWWS
jgi:hypothetical protein